MGKKRQQMNEFYFFMVEKKPEVEKRMGRSVKMDELPNLVYSEWKNLSEAKKQKYKDMKDRTRETTEKLDCRGVPLNELKRQEDAENQKIEDMKREIGNAIDFHKTGGALHHMSIYIASVSYYVRTDEDEYTAAELGIVHFNFEKGIMKEHHVIFKPVIPLCYGFIAQEHSQATHNLLDENNAGVEDLAAMVEDMKHFLSPGNERLPPFYTLEESKGFTRAILDSIADPGEFEVYSLDYFFQNLYSAALPDHAIPLSIATDMLTHCGLDFHPTMACEWHMNFQPDSGKYCSLSCVRRWAFNMCDNMNLSSTFGIEPQEGKHLPRAVPAYGVIVDVPKPTFKDGRSTGDSKLKQSDQNSFSFTPSRNKGSNGASAFPSPANSFGKNTPTTPRPLEALRKPKTSSWSSIVSPTLPGPSRTTSMASVYSSNTDMSEVDFPALGAGVARRGADGQPSYASLGGVGRGMLRSPLPTNRDKKSGLGHGTSSDGSSKF